MARFSLIIFDMDGVLADSSPCHARAYQDLWKEIGVEGPRYDSIMGRPTGEVIREVTRDLAPTTGAGGAVGPIQAGASSRIPSERNRDIPRHP